MSAPWTNKQARAAIARNERGLALLAACEAIEAASDAGAWNRRAIIDHCPDNADWSATVGEHGTSSASLVGSLLELASRVRGGL